MSNKEDILNNVRRNIKTTYEMPDITIDAITYPNLVEQFISISSGVGGKAVELAEGQDINELIKSLYPEAKNIASNVEGINIATINPDEVDDPHKLNGTDLGIVNGVFGVAENACVWIPQNVKEKVVYFISEYLVIIIDKKNLVNNMHEAYNRIEMNDYGFGVFISGPSKTADIEQALVIGAHGAKGVTVILK